MVNNHFSFPMHRIKTTSPDTKNTSSDTEPDSKTAAISSVDDSDKDNED